MAHLVQPPLNAGRNLRSEWVAQGHVLFSLEYLQRWRLHTLLKSPAPMSPTLIVKTNSFMQELLQITSILLTQAPEVLSCRHSLSWIFLLSFKLSPELLKQFLSGLNFEAAGSLAPILHGSLMLKVPLVDFLIHFKEIFWWASSVNLVNSPVCFQNSLTQQKMRKKNPSVAKTNSPASNKY